MLDILLEWVGTLWLWSWGWLGFLIVVGLVVGVGYPVWGGPWATRGEAAEVFLRAVVRFFWVPPFLLLSGLWVALWLLSALCGCS